MLPFARTSRQKQNIDKIAQIQPAILTERGRDLAQHLTHGITHGIP